MTHMREGQGIRYEYARWRASLLPFKIHGQHGQNIKFDPSRLALLLGAHCELCAPDGRFRVSPGRWGTFGTLAV